MWVPWHGLPHYCFDPGTQPHLHLPGGGGKVCLKLIPQVYPLNAGELKVLEGTHGTNPIVLRGGEVGLEKNTKNNNDKSKVRYLFSRVANDNHMLFIDIYLQLLLGKSVVNVLFFRRSKTCLVKFHEFGLPRHVVGF